MLARIPLAFTFCFDTCNIEEQVQWSFGAVVRHDHVQCSLATA